MEVISPFVLRAMACDIEEMQSPQAWADRCRAAAAEIERLRAALAECNVWVTAAIECKDWMWDGAQKEAAIFARDQARAALGEKE
jgi:hypothetical protein